MTLELPTKDVIVRAPSQPGRAGPMGRGIRPLGLYEAAEVRWFITPDEIWSSWFNNAVGSALIRTGVGNPARIIFRGCAYLGGADWEVIGYEWIIRYYQRIGHLPPKKLYETMKEKAHVTTT